MTTVLLHNRLDFYGSTLSKYNMTDSVTRYPTNKVKEFRYNQRSLSHNILRLMNTFQTFRKSLELKSKER